MDNKKSFVIYHNLYEPIKGLSNEQLGKLFRALFEYEINGVLSVDDDIQMPFAFFKNSLDINREKYKKRCEQNRKNAKKRWSENV